MFSLPLPLIGLSFLIASALCVHVVRTGQQMYWLWIILAFQPIGGIVYFVAIIAPAYNEEATIVDSVRAFLHLEYPSFTVVVVNDGSKDGTMRQLVERFRLEPVKTVYRRDVPCKEIRGLYRSPIELRFSFQNLLPAFVGLFAIPGLIQVIIFGTRLPPQQPATLAGFTPTEWMRGTLTGMAGGLFASILPVVSGGIVYMQDLESNVSAINLETGEVLWETKMEEVDQGPNGVTVDEGKVFGATATKAFALEAANGDVLTTSVWVEPGDEPSVRRACFRVANQDGTVVLDDGLCTIGVR